MLFCLLPTLYIAKCKISLDANFEKLTALDIIGGLKEAYKRIDVDA